MRMWRKIFKDMISELGKYIDIHDHVLDLGCGDNSPIQYLDLHGFKMGVDIYEKDIFNSKKKGIHNQYFVFDVRYLTSFIWPKSFDIVIALDLIEHLEKEDGFKLIKDMEISARKRIIILTPNGFIENKPHDENYFNIHKSGWNKEDFEKLGFKVIGINGLKYLRGEASLIKYRHKWLWERISDITQLIIKYFPEYAFHLLAIKEMKNINE